MFYLFSKLQVSYYCVPKYCYEYKKRLKNILVKLDFNWIYSRVVKHFNTTVVIIVNNTKQVVQQEQFTRKKIHDWFYRLYVTKNVNLPHIIVTKLFKASIIVSFYCHQKKTPKLSIVTTSIYFHGNKFKLNDILLHSPNFVFVFPVCSEIALRYFCSSETIVYIIYRYFPNWQIA